MGYAGKVIERQRARELRAQSWSLAAIAAEPGVSKGTVSVWVRDVEFEPRPRSRGHSSQQPHPLHLARLAEVERCRVEAREVVGEMTDRDLLMFGLALYAGEGSKTDGALGFATTNPEIVRTYLAWLRRFVEPDESRLRAKLYLHEGLDLGSAVHYWSRVTAIPEQQFTKPYRARADASIRRTKHEFGCLSVVYCSCTMHRRVIAMIEAVFSNSDLPG